MEMIDPALPLIDLHRHLDGNVRLQTILDLGRRHNLPLPADTVEGMRPYVQVTEPTPNVMSFIAKFEWMSRVLVDYEACRRVAYENVEDAHREGVDYIELRFSPCLWPSATAWTQLGWWKRWPTGWKPRAGFWCPCQSDWDLKPNVRGGDRLERAGRAAALSRPDCSPGPGRDEIHYPAEWFAEHFRRGREAGWEVTVHAGESMGPDSMWHAIHDLGATRIGHGVRAVEDPALMDYMAEHEIGFESCLTSNLQTSVVSSYAVHPLKTFLERGLLACINTDDPGISGIDLRFEYEVAAPAAGLTPQLARQAQRNALSLAFLPSNAKRTLAARKGGSVDQDPF
jgi:adenosine deaminase